MGKFLFIFLVFYSFNLQASMTCNNLLNSKKVIKKYVQPPFKKLPAPILFNSFIRNKALLTKNIRGLTEVSTSPARKQCFGTCYFEVALQTIEIELRRTKFIGSKDILSSFIPLMQRAWVSYSKSLKDHDLDQILSFEANKGVKGAIKDLVDSPIYFLNKEDLLKIGGIKKFYKIERKLLDTMYSISKKSVLEDLLKLPFDEFNKKTITLLERTVKKEIKLQKARINDFSVSEYSKSKEDTFPAIYNNWDSSVYSFKERTVASHLKEESYSQDTVSFETMVHQITDSIDNGHTITVSLDNVFSKSLKSVHAVMITGYFTNRKKEITGFKFLNSWGATYGSNGFGYLSLNQLNQGFNGIVEFNSRDDF